MLGHARSAERDVFVDNCRNDGIPLIRRHTGGGTVYQHPEVISFTFILPYMHADLKPRSRIRESMNCLLNPLINGLKSRGYSADIIGNGE